jgi:hypothetical protein
MTNEKISLEIIKNNLLKNISDKFNINYKDLLFELNDLSHLFTTRSRYECNHYFFSKDNEASFYWAGFLAADGCLYKKQNSKRLILSLAEKDLSHVQLLKNTLNYSGPISKSITKHSLTNSKWKDSIKHTICISSSQLFDDLNRFNLTQRKTHIYDMPNWLITHKLVNHFIRGYFDGDGCITFSKLPRKAEINIRGTISVLTQFMNIFENNLHINSKTRPKINSGFGMLKYSGNIICTEIKDYLYNDSTIYLKRKYDLCQSIVVTRKKYSNRKL